MPKLESVKNINEEIIYPYTHENGVITSDGQSIGDKFKNIEKTLLNKSNKDHTHPLSEISNFPSKLPAEGGNADTVNGKTVNDLADPSSDVIWTSKKTNDEIQKIKDDLKKQVEDLNLIVISDSEPTTIETKLWIDTSLTIPIIKFRTTDGWKVAGLNIVATEE